MKCCLMLYFCKKYLVLHICTRMETSNSTTSKNTPCVFMSVCLVDFCHIIKYEDNCHKYTCIDKRHFKSTLGIFLPVILLPLPLKYIKMLNYVETYP